MPAFPVPRFTHEEFLEREALSPFRHEFRRGRVEMMAGGTHHHSLVGANVIARMSALLADRDCEVHGGELLVYVAQAELSTYPDVLVICGAPRFCDRKRREVENPLVLFEVLSPSTEAYDRGEKFEAYKQLPSLREHVLLSPDRPRAERFLRDTGWGCTSYEGRDAVVALESLGVGLDLASVYRRVE